MVSIQIIVICEINNNFFFFVGDLTHTYIWNIPC